jgi:hypothetical protein
MTSLDLACSCASGDSMVMSNQKNQKGHPFLLTNQSSLPNNFHQNLGIT